MAEPITKFTGLINTVHPYHAPPGSLVQADNVLVDKSGAIERRPGYTKIINGTDITASYTTLDQKTMFLVDSGTLYAFNGTGAQALIAGLTDTPIHWCEESGDRVFLCGGGATLAINNRATVEELPNIGYPLGGIAYHNARMTLAIIDGTQTMIVMSVPYEPTVFDDTESSFIVPDVVLGMASVQGSLVMAGANALWVLSPDDILIRLTNYGCSQGKPISVSENVAYIWTDQGLCKFPEFANMTQETVSVPPGNGSSVNELCYNGSNYVVVFNDGEGVSNNAMFEI